MPPKKQQTKPEPRMETDGMSREDATHSPAWQRPSAHESEVLDWNSSNYLPWLNPYYLYIFHDMHVNHCSGSYYQLRYIQGGPEMCPEK